MSIDLKKCLVVIQLMLTFHSKDMKKTVKDKSYIQSGLRAERIRKI